jgi:hypothetical protein
MEHVTRRSHPTIALADALADALRELHQLVQKWLRVGPAEDLLPSRHAGRADEIDQRAPPRRILAGESGGPSSHHARHVQHVADEPAASDANRIVRLHGDALAARHPIVRVWKIHPGIDR